MEVTTVGGTGTLPNAYTYVAAPTISAASPASGSTLGGTSVILTGTGFIGATSVTFGGAAASNFIINNDTQITATTAAHASGVVDVVITTLGGTGTLTNGYTYKVPSGSLTLSPAILPAGTLSIAYTATVSASGGVGPYTFAVTAGTLPTGLTLNTITGAITGTPISNGTYNFTITATDTIHPTNTGFRAYSVLVSG